MAFESNNRDFCSKCEAHQLEVVEEGEDFVYSFMECLLGTNETEL